MVRTKRAALALAMIAAILLSLPVAQAGDKVNKVATVPVTDHGQAVSARADAEGTLHILYDTADGPQYVKSLDKGKTFSTAIPVVDKGSRKPGLEYHGSDMVVG